MQRYRALTAYAVPSAVSKEIRVLEDKGSVGDRVPVTLVTGAALPGMVPSSTKHTTPGRGGVNKWYQTKIAT